MSNFRPIDRDMDYLLPPSVNEWLPERHLARFVVEVVDGLDLSAMSRSYRGSGSAPYHPSVLVGLLVYGYASGVFSSRQLERATYDSVAFRFVASNQHPDHDTIASFRRRFLPRIEALFVEVLQVAREMGLLKLGCQSASKFDPLSAFNIDPLAAISGGSGRPAKRVRVAQPGGCGGVTLRPRRGS